MEAMFNIFSTRSYFDDKHSEANALITVACGFIKSNIGFIFLISQLFIVEAKLFLSWHDAGHKLGRQVHVGGSIEKVSEFSYIA